MSKVYTGASMSLDGYISGPNETGFEHLFKWYGNGDVAVETADPNMTVHVTEESAAHFRRLQEMSGSLVVGRHLFDMTGGWNGLHPMGVKVVVLTHRPPEDAETAWPNFRFVTEGIEAAVDEARRIAGDKVVGINGGVIARQCLDAGLLDEIWVDLVPVILGGGTPFFSELAKVPVELEGPLEIVDAKDVTHLRYRVKKG
jgi:dihydrofolate reductase